ncbi:MAG: prepilin-type N-terminal cleavage/methylation domain-containing protein [Planctomycetota bacterium]
MQSRRQHAGASSRRKGFSLVEMILVVAVIALLASVVSSSLDTMLPRERLNTAVRNLTAQLRDTRSESVGRSLEFFVEYDIDGNRYRQVTPFARDGERFREGENREEERLSLSWDQLPPGVEIASVTINGETFTDGRVFARFDPRGAASGHQVVLSQPRYENFYTVEVMALTGTFKFHRGIFIREAPDERDFN